uniref:ATP synthase F0 subunit 8 n=1 Tax=Hydatophylax nigrovittatus TaxID=1310303 RepID=A0A4Y1JWI8_9NEOP|nr:ATP synthase F0 subunit 8 [Hydatophylax nigrovittatus]APQ47880.1 ATP synthase F0 subunit 8 [Hydatophylax nigrovittatus]
MPQMMPLNWVFLYFMFNTILYLFMINNYFNLNFSPNKIKSLKLNYSKPFHNLWPLN